MAEEGQVIAFAGKIIVTSSASRPLAVIILAAGQGTRMKSSLHKVLHPIAGRSMLLHLLASVSELAPERQVVLVGAGRAQVEKAVAGTGAVIAVQEATGHRACGGAGA